MGKDMAYCLRGQYSMFVKVKIRSIWFLMPVKTGEVPTWWGAVKLCTWRIISQIIICDQAVDCAPAAWQSEFRITLDIVECVRQPDTQFAVQTPQLLSLVLVLWRSERPVRHRGALSPPPLPSGQESAHASETEDPAPSVWRALLLVRTVSPVLSPNPVCSNFKGPVFYPFSDCCFSSQISSHD